MILFDKPSFQSLALRLQFLSTNVGVGTGFVVTSKAGRPFLVTNWHVFSGRNPTTREVLHSQGAVPDSVSIMHNTAGTLGSWTPNTVALVNPQGEPLWYEHATFGSRVDVAALPLDDTSGVDYYPYKLSGPEGHDVAGLPRLPKWGASDFVNIIGFPFGWTAGGSLGIWVQGAIASEPAVDYEGLPCFLVDSRTRPGQSGSPVVIYKRNGWITLDDGRPYMIHNLLSWCVGMYSGRLSKDSDLGRVWKAQVVQDVVEKGVLPKL